LFDQRIEICCASKRPTKVEKQIVFVLMFEYLFILQNSITLDFTMTEPLFLSERHIISKKAVVLVDEGTSVWCYLTEPGESRPIADCWLLNTIEAPENVDALTQEESAPPATRLFVTDSAQRALPAAEAVSFQWSKDGESVAVYIEQELLGFIAGNDCRGYSANLRKEGPFGSPLDHDLFSNLFR
jgi:hypothetical protein